MSRAPKSFNRKSPQFAAEPSVLVISEDSSSNLIYLQHASRAFRANVHVDIVFVGHTDPRGIVESAISRMKNFDIVYCVFDRDRHETFDEAMALAAQHEKIIVIPSYPCFEFWYILHFGYYRRPFVAEGRLSPGDCAVAVLKTMEEMAEYDKGSRDNLFVKLGPARLAVARGLAPRVLQAAVDERAPNPSTMVHLLINKFEELGSPRLLHR